MSRGEAPCPARHPAATLTRESNPESNGLAGCEGAPE